MLPNAVLQPASLFTEGFGRQRPEKEPLAGSGRRELPLSASHETRESNRPLENPSLKPLAAGAGPEVPAKEEAPIAWDQPDSRPENADDRTWSRSVDPAVDDRQSGQEEAPDNQGVGGLGHLEQALRSDLIGFRAAAKAQWKRLRPKLSALKSVKVKQHRWLWAFVTAAVLFFTPVGDGLRSSAEDSISQIGAESRTRAAFQFIEDFREGSLAQWDGDGLTTDGETTAVRAASLTLYEGTMDLSDYYMDFDFILDRPSLGWVVRASDRDSYCAFKLEQTGRRDDPKYKFVRYPVIDGEIDTTQQFEVDVTPDFHDEGHNRISVRITGQRIKTFLNGRGIDFWNDNLFHRGGIGFWNANGTSGQIQRVAVYGNEDFWGLTLYAALEAADSVKQLFSTAMPASGPTQAL